MKYIVRDENGSFDLRRYEEYLDRKCSQLDGLIEGERLTSLERFDLSGPASFHDARFEGLSADVQSGNASDGCRRVSLRLKGAYFDRYFLLTYEQVSFLSIGVPDQNADLLVHEVRDEDGGVVHELLFDGPRTITVACERLEFKEELIANTNSG